MMWQIIYLLIFQLALFVLLLIFFRKRMGVFSVFFSAFCLFVTPFCFVFGVFFGSLNSNICYSQVIFDLNSASKIAALSSDEAFRREYVHKLDSIVPYGYETQCENIRNLSSEIYSSIKISD